MRPKKGFALQIFLCLATLSACWFSYLEKQNELTELRIYVPKLVKELRSIQEENIRLNYMIQEFESPEHLMQLASSSEFSHLKYPFNKEVLVLQEAVALQLPQIEKNELSSPKFKHTLAVGAK